MKIGGGFVSLTFIQGFLFDVGSRCGKIELRVLKPTERPQVYLKMYFKIPLYSTVLLALSPYNHII
jgi:hypothetical protein